MIYVTADTHGSLDIRKLSSKKFKEGKTLTKNDYVIILGDFGLIFNNQITEDEKFWLKWLNKKPWTTLFIDGNHDNHIKLQSNNIVPLNTEEYNVRNMFGSIVGQIYDYSVYHLRRGHIYNIDSMKFFCMGGALSIDRPTRIIDVSWWKDEEPNHMICDFALGNLEKNQYNVDYILSHTGSKSAVKNLLTYYNMPEIHERVDSTTVFLEHVIQCTNYKKLFCGHFHVDVEIDKTYFLYDNIIPVEMKGLDYVI